MSSKQLIPSRQGKLLFTHQNVMRLETILSIVQRTLLRDFYYWSTGSTFLTNFFDYQTLGNGAFGTVTKVQKRPFHIGDEFDVLKFTDKSFTFESEFAIKIIPNYKLDAATSEIKSLANLIHPNVVSCYNVWEEHRETVSEIGWKLITDELLHFKNKSSKSYSNTDESTSEEILLSKCLFLQYEFCSGGTLQDVLDSRDKLAWANGDLSYTVENKNIFLQILEGLVYLQYQGVIHGDLKPDNIFIIQKDNVKVAKIGDFGLSLNINENSDLLGSQDFKEQDSGNADAWKGFPRLYMPPENLDGIRSHKGDMYSFGLIFLTMLVPFETPEKRRYALLDAMCSTKDRKYPPKFSQKFPHESEWIEKLLNHSIDSRPSALELREIIYELCIKNIISHYDVINNGENSQPDGSFKALTLAMKFSAQKNYRQAYRYLCPEFYKYFRRFKANTSQTEKLTNLESDFDLAFAHEMGGSLESLSTISRTLGKTHDEFYRHSEILRCLLHKYSTSRDNMEIIIEQFRIVKILKSIEEDSIYEQLVRSGLPEKDSYIKETLTKIEESLTFQNLNWKSKLKLEVEMEICEQLLNNGDSQSLEKALEKLIWVEQGVKENEQEWRNELFLYNRNFKMECQVDKLLGCRILRAKVLHELGRVEEAKENFLWILGSSFFIYDKAMRMIKAIPYLLYEYAGFILTNENRLETALLYLQAGYEIRKTFDQTSLLYSEADKLLVLLYRKLGLKEGMEAFIKSELVETQREKDFSMLTRNDELFNVLLDSKKFYKDLEKMFGVRSNTEGFCLESSGIVFESEVENSLGRRYESVEELVDYPPFDLIRDGWWHREVIFWAKRFLKRVNSRKGEEISYEGILKRFMKRN